MLLSIAELVDIAFEGYFLPMLFEASTSAWEQNIQDEEFKNMIYFVDNLWQSAIWGDLSADIWLITY